MEIWNSATICLWFALIWQHDEAMTQLFNEEASERAVITLLAAPGTSARVEPYEILRGEGESDEAYKVRQALLVELWAIPDCLCCADRHWL